MINYALVCQHVMLSAQHKFSLLDLGCGDSLPAAKMLSASPSLATNLTHYVGVDMSLPAMTLSASNLTAALPASCSIEYIQVLCVIHVEWRSYYLVCRHCLAIALASCVRLLHDSVMFNVLLHCAGLELRTGNPPC